MSLHVVIPELKGFYRSSAELSCGQAHSGDTLFSCCSEAKFWTVTTHRLQVFNFSAHHSGGKCTASVSSAVQFCSDTTCDSPSDSFSITPCCLGLPGPYRHQVQHPDDLWSLTCKHPAGCPVVHGSQLVGQHHGPARGHVHLDQQNHHDHAFHPGLTTKTHTYDCIALVWSQQIPGHCI